MLVLAQAPKQVYLRSNQNQSVTIWTVIKETEKEWIAKTDTLEVKLSKREFSKATEEEWEQEKWADSNKSNLIQRLYMGNRVPYVYLKQISYMIGEE